MGQNTLKHIEEAIYKKTWTEGEKIKLACSVALQIAKEFEVKPSEIGALCDELKIKISKCQLGCFD